MTEKFDLPWVEKYRPQKLEDIVGNDDVILRLQALENKVINLLLVGKPGTAKTSSALCLARQSLPDPSQEKEHILELNASDDRGLDVIKTKIKPFVEKKISPKTLILDEADSMPKNSQQALRQLMIQYQSTTSFIIICNQLKPIIKPMRSRCVLLRFHALTNEAVLKRLLFIIREEKLIEQKQYTPEGIKTIIENSNGDLRRAIADLQAVYVGFGCIDEQNACKILDKPLPQQLKKILLLCARMEKWEAIDLLKKVKVRDGYSSEDIVENLLKTLKTMPEFSDHSKFEYARRIASTKERIQEGCCNFSQLSALLVNLSQTNVTLIKV